MSYYYKGSAVKASDLLYSYTDGCPVRLDDLVQVEFNHFNFEGGIVAGQFVINVSIVEKMERILETFYRERFPIHSAIPIDHPDFVGSDVKSMDANNSSSFNFRLIAGTNRPSNHSSGTAVDINPVQNPYQYADGHWGPLHAEVDYTNRRVRKIGMFFSDCPVVQAFATEGFEWGGTWSRPDYHHFELID